MVLGRIFKVHSLLYPTGTGMDSTIFMNMDVARELCLESEVLSQDWAGKDPFGLISVIMVKLEPGVNPGDFQKQVEQSGIDATKAIEQVFHDADLKYTVREIEKVSFLEAGLASHQGIQSPIRFLSSDDDNDVAVRISPLVRVPEDKTGEILKLINGYHSRYRYIRFCLDSDNDLIAGYDLAVKAENIGETALEIFIRFSQVLDDVYPEIMRVIWS